MLSELRRQVLVDSHGHKASLEDLSVDLSVGDYPLVTNRWRTLILGVLNAFLRPILLLLTLPLNLLTLGLFTLVVNAIVFWLATMIQGGGVRVADFGSAFLGALIVTVVSFIASRVIT